MKRIIYCVCITLLVSGCTAIKDKVNDLVEGGEDNSDPPAPLVKIEQKVAINTLWSTSIGSGLGDKFLKLVPHVANGRVFAADIKGKVSAHDAASGSAVWTTDLNVPISGGPGVGEGLVLVGTSEAQVIALDEKTGTERWRKRVSSEVLAAPAIDNGIVIARTIDGKVIGMDAKTGRRIWVYDHKVPVLSLRGASAPVISNGVAVVGFASGKLAAFRVTDGALLWETRVAIPHGRSDLARMVDIDGNLIVADGVIHVVTFQGSISTVLLQNGRVLWNREMSSHSAMAYDRANLYVTDDSGDVWALDRRSGASLWKQDKLHARKVTGPAVYGSYVVVGDFEGYLHWMNSQDGSFVARTKIDSKAIAIAPETIGDIVYVSSVGGTLSAVRPAK